MPLETFFYLTNVVFALVVLFQIWITIDEAIFLGFYPNSKIPRTIKDHLEVVMEDHVRWLEQKPAIHRFMITTYEKMGFAIVALTVSAVVRWMIKT